MKKFTSIAVLMSALSLSAATNSPTIQTTIGEPKAEEKGSYLSAFSVSPYATVAFEDFDGKARTGAGVELGIGVSKTVSFVAFAESDDTDNNFVDRAGLGFRVTGKLGKRFHPFAGLLGGYVFDESTNDAAASEPWFLRPQFGAGIDLAEFKGWRVSAEAAWGLDVTMDGRSRQRLTGFLAIKKGF